MTRYVGWRGCTPSDMSAAYVFDIAGWLKSETHNGATDTYAVNAIGNLISKAGNMETYSHSAKPHAVTQWASSDGKVRGQYVYNDVGNLTHMEEDGVVTTFEWNANNMPVRTTRGGDVTERFYVGESLFKRRDRQNGQETVTYFLPGLRIENSTYRKNYGMAERESQPFADDVLMRRGQLRFYHSNHVGSATLVTDANGTPIHRAVYEPYGAERKKEGAWTPKHEFGGKEQESISGLYDFGARLYNPRVGRFVSADTVMDGLNPYSYVHNNPVDFVDPSGHQSKTVAEKAIPPIIHEYMEVVGKLEKKSFWGIVKSAASKVKGAVSQFLTPRGDSSLSMSVVKGALRDSVMGLPWGTSSMMFVDASMVHHKADVALGMVQGAVNVAVGTVNWFYPEWEEAYGEPLVPSWAPGNAYQAYGQTDFNVAATVAPMMLGAAKMGAWATAEPKYTRIGKTLLVNAMPMQNASERNFLSVALREIQSNFSEYDTVLLAHGNTSGVSVPSRREMKPLVRGADISDYIGAFQGVPGTERVCIFAWSYGTFPSLAFELASLRNAQAITVFKGSLPYRVKGAITWLRPPGGWDSVSPPDHWDLR